MPSPNKRKKLCIFGDSHIGCIKNAITQKVFTTRRAMDFEFWGADGPRFRSLDLEGSKIVPRAEVLETVRLVNGNGRDVLDPADFDAILFMATRIRMQDIFTPLLHRMQQTDGYLSKAVFRQIFQDWLPRNRAYRAAKAMAETGTAKIFIAPTTFITEGFDERLSSKELDARNASEKDRTAIWGEITRVAENDNITLLPQPQETVTMGCFTRKEFANVMDDGKIDPVHRNPKYAALIMQKVLDNFYS